MRRIFIILILVVTVSCSEHAKVRKIMREFVKSEIIVPDDLELIYHREIKNLDLNDLFARKLIVYYDTLDCLSCRAAHVHENHDLFVMSDTSDFPVYIDLIIPFVRKTHKFRQISVSTRS